MNEAKIRIIIINFLLEEQEKRRQIIRISP